MEKLAFPLQMDKSLIHKIIEEQNIRTGFIYNPYANPQHARESMIEQGVIPEDNAFSCEIIRMREGE